jgi:hypothetical protein
MSGLCAESAMRWLPEVVLDDFGGTSIGFLVGRRVHGAKTGPAATSPGPANRGGPVGLRGHVGGQLRLDRLRWARFQGRCSSGTGCSRKRWAGWV